MFLNTVLSVYVPVKAFCVHQTKQFIKRTEGASGIEYAIIAGMVAVALAVFVGPISTALGTMFDTLMKAVGGTKPT